MTAPEVGLLDTSVFIALESGREADEAKIPVESYVSAVTYGELEAGVLAAPDAETRARRLDTLLSLAEAEILPVDLAVAKLWARLRAHLVETKRRVNVNDLWIAATAAAYGMPVVTQDGDFDPIEGVAGLTVVRV